MRQAVEAQVLSPHCELGEQGLRQVLTDVLEEVRRSLDQEIDGPQILHSLLNAPWLQSLLKVYECLQRFTKTSPAPTFDSASGLSLQVLIEIRALQDCSEDAKELYRLMRQPHVQAVLSAHDSVAQKDYEPVLPALPEELPDDEEATRIVCLVKNKQPLFGLQQNSCSQSLSHSLTQGFLQESRPAPLLCGSFLIDHLNERLSDNHKNHRPRSVCHWRLSQHSCPQTANHTPQQARSAPPSPAASPRTHGDPDDLRASVQQAVTLMESSTRSLQVLAEKMSAAAERMSRTAQDSSQALVQLTQEVDRLQTLITFKVSMETSMGATIKRNEMTGEIFVARVIHGGLADRSGLLHAGDRIMEVNGFSVDGMEPEQVIQVVACAQGTIMFKVVPITERAVHSQTMMYVRAMADYNPQLDPAIPCPDAGVTFAQGDILEIVDQTDSLWWQAKKLPSSSACAGLVPSTALLKRKQREHWWSQPYQPHACIHTLSTVEEEEDSIAIDDKCVEADEEAFESEELREGEDEFSDSQGQSYHSGFRRSLRLCRRRVHSHVQTPSCQTQCLSSCCYSALCSPYEEVVRYQRNPRDPLRLVALMGASGVGVNELRRRLIDMNPQLFQGAIPCTSRPPREYEEPCRDYHFVSRDAFEKMINENKFVEYGEYKGNYYGTSSESVMEVLTNGKICVLDIEPSALQAVRTPDLRAYVIYIKPPSAECLRKTRHSAQILTNYYATRPFKEDDFLELEEASRKMELHFSQFFDHVVINEELQESCIQLWSAATRAQDQPQWVPAGWIRPQQETHIPQ